LGSLFRREQDQLLHWQGRVSERLKVKAPEWDAAPTVRAVLAAQAYRVSELRSKEGRFTR